MNTSLKYFKKRLSQLFPNVISQFVFVGYISFCVGQGIFVTASKREDKSYDYNTVTVVLLTEVMKLIIATTCFLLNDTVSSLYAGIKDNLKILLLYLVPSFLYCLYNNLAFVNLSHFDPTSYFILLQLRVVVTGIVFQIVFHKKLSFIQWISLLFLTLGCMVQQFNWDYFLNLFAGFKGETQDVVKTLLYVLLVIVQTLCSCFAGVYNEYLLKDAGSDVNIFIQNIFMYVDSIIWNLILISFQGGITTAFSADSFSHIMHPLIIVIIVNNSLVGIITSLFLKNLNSILKTFASAIEILITVILSWVIFGIPIKLNTIAAVVIVVYSIYLYSQNPIKNNQNYQRLVDMEKEENHLNNV